jgi:hypothetical protein
MEAERPPAQVYQAFVEAVDGDMQDVLAPHATVTRSCSRST